MNPITALVIALAGSLLYAFSLTLDAGLVWLGLLVIVALYEVWALTHHGVGAKTLSEWVWAEDTRHRWFRYVVMGSCGLLMWHFFYGPR